MDIELAAAVAALRDELVAAAGRAPEAGVSFKVGPIELEFAVELKVDAKVKSGIKAWVVSADAEAGVARGRTHRVKVTLNPVDAQGKALLVAADDRPVGPGE